ncbi:recombinase family protein [Vallitalea sp.]|jgi:DNA invertase Pin-like site-specific DNA recombinase|uniref:recombinase family protein n=1 Tax=Vallitalea sp. TaxID=1882829 RepID=UPI0025CF05A8|nr:recombinase family protein [Vallitalea sp.]MCT4686590.1 recombinase family protein [Vallitalea sp.]
MKQFKYAKMRAYALYRVSTEHQDEELQRKSVRDFCSRHKIQLIQEFTEKDVSGYKTKLEDREELGKILARATESRDFDILLVFKHDRIIRRSEEWLMIVKMLSSRGIKIIETDTEEEINNDTHESTIINFLKGWSSEGESVKISQRVKASFDMRNAMGQFLGGIPFGYKVVETNETNLKGKYISDLVIDKREAHVIRFIFDLYINHNMGTVKIANELNNNKKYETRARFKKDKKDIKANQYIWRATTISRILRNPIYIGRKVYNASYTTRESRVYNTKASYKMQPYNKKLRIISDEEFDTVQELLEKRKRYKGKQVGVPTISENALCSGIIYCKCGAKLKTGYSVSKYFRKRDNTNVEKKVYYYICPNGRVNKKQHQEITNRISYSVTKYDKIIEALILQHIIKFDATKLTEKIMNKKNRNFDIIRDKISELTTTRKKVEAQIQNMERQYDELFTVDISQDDRLKKKQDYQLERIFNNKDRLEVIINNIEKLQEELDKLHNLEKEKEKVIRFYDGLEGRFNKASLNEKRAILGQLIEKIIIMDDKERLIHVSFKY